MKSKLKICVVLVDRANYGRLFPVMHELKNNQECILQTICSGTMMLEKFGYADFESNLKVHNYDTNKSFKFVVNDIDWKLRNYNFSSGINSSLIGQIKNVNYSAKNIEKYKESSTNEFFGALGFLSKIDLYKGSTKNNLQLLTPKILIRYAPEHMKKETSTTRLNQLNVFSLDRLNTPTNFESGLNATLGFDYELNKNKQKLKFSAAQVVNEKENKNMPSSSSLDEKLSDLVASTNFKINDKVSFDYNFALDQNYNDLNYNEIGTNLNFSPFKISINYLDERKHIGSQQYLLQHMQSQISSCPNLLLGCQKRSANQFQQQAQPKPAALALSG